MIDLFQLKQQFLEIGEITAWAVVRIIQPEGDEVCYSEACKLAGNRRWIDFHEKAGNLTPHRRGTAKNSKKYFSRMEIYSLKQAEKISKFGRRGLRHGDDHR